MKKYNYKKIIATIAILFSLAVSIYLWNKAVQWDNKVEQSQESWYGNPVVSRLEVMLRYDIAFKEIILLNGLVFGLLYLLMKNQKNKVDI